MISSVHIRSAITLALALARVARAAVPGPFQTISSSCVSVVVRANFMYIIQSAHNAAAMLCPVSKTCPELQRRPSRASQPETIIVVHVHAAILLLARVARVAVPGHALVEQGGKGSEADADGDALALLLDEGVAQRHPSVVLNVEQTKNQTERRPHERGHSQHEQHLLAVLDEALARARSAARAEAPVEEVYGGEDEREADGHAEHGVEGHFQRGRPLEEPRVQHEAEQTRHDDESRKDGEQALARDGCAREEDLPPDEDPDEEEESAKVLRVVG